MTRHVLTVTPDATIGEAARLMLKHKLAGLPVVDEGSDSVVGILTESDIFRMVVKTWEAAEVAAVRGRAPALSLQ